MTDTNIFFPLLTFLAIRYQRSSCFYLSLRWDIANCVSCVNGRAIRRVMRATHMCPILFCCSASIRDWSQVGKTTTQFPSYPIVPESKLIRIMPRQPTSLVAPFLFLHCDSSRQVSSVAPRCNLLFTSILRHIYHSSRKFIGTKVWKAINSSFFLLCSHILVRLSEPRRTQEFGLGK